MSIDGAYLPLPALGKSPNFPSGEGKFVSA